MYEFMQAHPLTLTVIAAAVLVAPFYLLATFVRGGASTNVGVALGFATVAWGGVVTWVCLARVPDRIGMLGLLVVPVSWLTPSLLIVLCWTRIRGSRLSQHWLIGLQLWRAIGGLFLVEMARGNLPGIFVYPAGVGDLIVAALAGVVLWRYRKSTIPPAAVLLVAGVGLADFAGAFFFGFFSSDGPQQLFTPTTPNNVLLYPTGMIPLFLVPYAIAFHTLSLLELRRSTIASYADQPASCSGVKVAG